MDYIVLGIVTIIVMAAIVYIVKAKKKGVKCIGCSSAGKCMHHQALYDERDEHHCCNCK